MNNEFKPGDLVFELKGDRIGVGKLTKRGENTVRLEGGSTTYISSSGYALGDLYLGKLFHATPENRQALVTLFGEDAVPKLPMSPQEVTLKLLENQKYQLCRVSNHSTDWKHNKNLKAIVHIGVFGEFLDSNGEGWTYGIPIDNNGNEITEIEE